MILLRYLCGRFLRPLPFVCVTLIVYGVKNKLLWKFIADFQQAYPYVSDRFLF